MLSFLLALSTHSIAIDLKFKNLPEKISYYSSNYKIEYNIGKESLDFEALKKFIKTNKIKSVDGLLKSFSEDKGRFNQLLEEYALVDASRGIESADVSSETPRAILHRDRLFLTFTDGASAPKESNVHAYFQNVIPIIEFSKETQDFKFRQIKFNSDGVEYIDKPVGCNKCHGEPPRPNWFPYPVWPDAFGMEFLDTKPSEINRIKKFTEAAKKSDSRYRFLKPSPSEFEKDMTREKDRYRAPSQSFNFRLSFHLQHLNFISIWNKLSSSKHFSKIKYAFLGALLECKDLETFPSYGKLNKSLKSFEESYLDISKQFLEITEKQFKGEKDRELAATEAGRRHLYGDENIKIWAKMGWILQNTELDPLDWPISYIPKQPKIVDFDTNAGAHVTGMDQSAAILENFLKEKLITELKVRDCDALKKLTQPKPEPSKRNLGPAEPTAH